MALFRFFGVAGVALVWDFFHPTYFDIKHAEIFCDLSPKSIDASSVKGEGLYGGWKVDAIEIVAIRIEPSSEVHFFATHGFCGFYGHKIPFDDHKLGFHLGKVFATDFG